MIPYILRQLCIVGLVLFGGCADGDAAPEAPSASGSTAVAPESVDASLGAGRPGRPPPPVVSGGPGRPAPALSGRSEPATPGVEGPEASVSGRIPLLNRRPREAASGGRTLWIRGTVPGVEVGQVRFHSADGPDAPLQVICLAEVVDGRFEAEAPPNGPDVYVSVVSLAAEADPAAPQPWGVLAEPLPLAGADHDVSLSIGERADWTARLQVGPERIVAVSEVNPR